jgi:hypothetical protein
LVCIDNTIKFRPDEGAVIAGKILKSYRQFDAIIADLNTNPCRNALIVKLTTPMFWTRF